MSYDNSFFINVCDITRIQTTIPHSSSHMTKNKVGGIRSTLGENYKFVQYFRLKFLW